MLKKTIPLLLALVSSSQVWTESANTTPPTDPLQELIEKEPSYSRDPQSENLPKWTILVYMEADNSLSSFAVNNLDEMRRAASSKNVQLIVQWSKPDSRQTCRLKVENGRVYDVGSLNQPMGVNPVKEVFDAFRWMKEKYPAEHYAFIAWDHGSGILDRTKKSWLKDPLGFNTPDNANIEDLSKMVEDEERAILFNETQGTSLSTNDMKFVLERAREILDQPLDILAMDACLMAMIEICYAVRHSSTIVVASENTEPGKGYNYIDIINKLAKLDGQVTPEEMASLIVSKYASSYLKNEPSYTQSAIKINAIDQVKDTLNQLTLDLLNLKLIDKITAIKTFEYAHKNCTKYNKDYIDLYSFCSELNEIASGLSQSPSSSDRHTTALKNLIHSTTATKSAIKNAVFSNSAGSEVINSYGISIYCPNIITESPNPSYRNTEFAKHSTWNFFLSSFARSREPQDAK